MVPLGEIAKRLERLIADNSPAILTALGAVGTLTTAYLTGKASFKAAEILAREKDARLEHDMGQRYLDDRLGPIGTRDAVKLVWKQYIPAGSTVILTVAAIVFANRIGTRRAAAIAIAYSLSERAFEEYREKIVEKIGEKKEQLVHDEIAQDRVNANPITSREVVITGSETQLCYEAYTGRYFLSDMETLRQARNDINEEVLNDGYASLSEFYVRIGLPQTTISDEIGWTTDKLLELQFSGTLTSDNRPCMVMNYRTIPKSLRHH